MAEFNSEVDDTQDSGDGRKINCLKCRYFEVTWDPNFPRGCKIFGIKSRKLPSETVKASTGRDCPSFKPKDSR